VSFLTGGAGSSICRAAWVWLLGGIGLLRFIREREVSYLDGWVGRSVFVDWVGLDALLVWWW